MRLHRLVTDPECVLVRLKISKIFIFRFKCYLFAAYKYAMTLNKLMIARVVRNYRFSTKLKMEELQIRFNVNIRLLNNHMVSIHNRTD